MKMELKNEMKNEICDFIRGIFENNKKLSSFSLLINCFFLDGIFTIYLKQYVGKIDLDDTETIKHMLESALQIKLEDYFTEDEIDDLYYNSKKYIKILLADEYLY
jgi:hypothetical protein